MQLYERNINSTVRKLDDKRLVTEASLLDLNHSIRVILTIHVKKKQIEDARAVFLKAPLKVCDSTGELLEKLKGMKLERGINRKLIETLARADGCTHLYELVLNAVRLTFNVLIGMDFNWSEWVTKTIPDDQFVKAAMPHLENSCRPFKK